MYYLFQELYLVQSPSKKIENLLVKVFLIKRQEQIQNIIVKLKRSMAIARTELVKIDYLQKSRKGQIIVIGQINSEYARIKEILVIRLTFFLNKINSFDNFGCVLNESLIYNHWQIVIFQ
ncbi:unnamed protein product [Paramecium sonneborni]|uniref:Uncharacterized protein n=1 Tax=Paramecium sonneborni TaxID=65129 RepID=A0A8S1QY96_9CILI|nr:unnamed protein product [Paramecium sonneborni]